MSGSRSASLPFTLRRSDDIIAGGAVTSTQETIHGLLRLEGDRVTIQWRRSRETDHFGREIRTDRQVDSVRSATIPLKAVAGAHVRQRRWPWKSRPILTLTATDLRAFEEITGEQGLALAHPAELALPLRRPDRLRAEEFAAELALAIAEIGSDMPRAASRGESGGT